MSEPQSIREQISIARKEASKTGRRIKKTFGREGFIKQFPKAGSDPRMAMTGETFNLELTPMEGITAGELRRLCLAKGNHPLAIQKAQSVEGYPDEHVFYVLRQDLDELKRDCKGVTTSLPESTPEGELTLPAEEED